MTRARRMMRPRLFCASVAAVAREHHHSVGGNHDRTRCAEAMHRAARGINRAAVAGHYRVDPVVVDIAIKDLEPGSAERESDLIAPPCRFVEARDHDDVPARALEPSMVRDDAILVVD